MPFDKKEDEKMRVDRDSHVLACMNTMREIIGTDGVEGISQEELATLKLTSLEQLSKFVDAILGSEAYYNNGYTVYSGNGLDAYYSFNDGKVNLVFRQEGPTNTMHYYFKTGEEILKAQNHLNLQVQENVERGQAK